MSAIMTGRSYCPYSCIELTHCTLVLFMGCAGLLKAGRTAAADAKTLQQWHTGCHAAAQGARHSPSVNPCRRCACPHRTGSSGGGRASMHSERESVHQACTKLHFVGFVQGRWPFICGPRNLWGKGALRGKIMVCWRSGLAWQYTWERSNIPF